MAWHNFLIARDRDQEQLKKEQGYEKLKCYGGKYSCNVLCAATKEGKFKRAL